MGEAKLAKRGRGRGTEGPAAEAWSLLTGLVYPPPFLPIVRELGLRPASYAALRALEEPRTMGEIAAVLHCDRSNVTGIVDSLEERDLARRTASASDRRVKLIALTPAGRRLRTRLMRAVEKPPAWLEGMSAEDQRALRDLLARVSAGDA
jgi:MarR family transcriptional regulator, organic hydroperoxide resistance regulator